jgi:hypothetical protein
MRNGKVKVESGVYNIDTLRWDMKNGEGES